MKFRVSGRYWSQGQFQNRGINVLGSVCPRPSSSSHNLLGSRVQGSLCGPAGPGTDLSGKPTYQDLRS